MFKKLKDKIAEEVKQSPLKSVQQLAQAVVSPSSSSVFEPSSSNDKFCIEEGDIEEDEKQEQAKPGGFTSVTLTGQTTSPVRDHDQKYGFRSSSGSLMSEADNLFPKFEPQPTNYHVQSDWESASEVEDRYSQLEHINKESLYEAYRKVYSRYNRMKNKYHEVVAHYRQLEKEKEKAKTVLTETQDKALLRISELREQCLLEQQAKAHLEEALRNELEERDHIINTLKTKVQYLKGVSDTSATESLDASHLSKEEANLIDFTENSSASTVPLPFDASNCEEKILWFEEKLKALKNLLNEETSKVGHLKTKLKEAREQNCDLEDANLEKMDDNETFVSGQKTEKELARTLSDLITNLTKEVHNLQKNAVHCSLLKSVNDKDNLGLKLTDDDSEKFTDSNKLYNVQSDEMMRYTSSIKQLEEQNKALAQRLQEESSSTKELSNELNSLSTVIDVLKRKIKLSNQNFGKSDAVNCLITDMENELIHEWNLCFQNFLQTRCEITVLKDTREDLEKELLRVKEAKIKSENMNKEMTEKNNKLKGDIEILQKDLKNYLAQLETLSRERSDLKVSHEHFERQIKQLEDTVKHSEKVSNEKQEDVQKIIEEKNSAETKLSSLESELKNARSENSLLLEAKQQLDIEVSSLRKETCDVITEKEALNNIVNEMENKLKQVKDDYRTELDKRDELDNQINSLTKEADELTSEKSILLSKILNLEKVIENNKVENVLLLEEKDKLLQEMECIKDQYEVINREKLGITDKFNDLVNELKNNKDNFSKSLESAQQRSDELCSLREERDELIKEKHVLESKIENLRKEITNFKESCTEAVEVNERLSEELSSVREERDNLASEIQLVQNRIVELDSASKAANEELSLIKKEHAQLTTEKNHMQKEIQRLEECLKSNIENYSSSSEINMQLSQEIVSLKKDRDDLIKEKSALANRSEKVDANLSICKEELSKLSEEYNKIGDKLQVLQKENEALLSTKQIEQDTAEEIKNDLKEKEKKLASVTENNNKLSNEIKKLKNEFGQIEKEYNSLQDRYNSVVTEHENNKALTASLTQIKNELSEEVDSLKKNCENAYCILNKTNAQVQKEQNTCSELKDQLCSLSESLKKKCDETNEKYEENGCLKTEIEKLTEKINVLNSSIEKLTREKNFLLNDLLSNLSNVKIIRELQKNLYDFVKQFQVEISREINDINIKMGHDLLKHLNDLLDPKTSGKNFIELECKSKKEIDSYNSKLKNLHGPSNISEDILQVKALDLESVSPVDNELNPKMVKFRRMGHLEKSSELDGCISHDQNTYDPEGYLKQAILLMKSFTNLLNHNSVSNDYSVDMFMPSNEKYIRLNETEGKNLQKEIVAMESFITDCETKYFQTDSSRVLFQKLNESDNTSDHGNSLEMQLRQEIRLKDDIIKKLQSVIEEFEQKNDGDDSDFLYKQKICMLERENQSLLQKLQQLQETQEFNVKNLISEYEKKLEEIEEEKNLYDFEKLDKEKKFVVNEMREQIQNLQQDLEERGDAFEKLYEEHQQSVKSLDEEIYQLRSNHDKELREQDKKWRQCLDRRVAEEETRHQQELASLNMQWNAERRELETARRLAVNAVESGSGSHELLRRQVQALTMQLAEMRNNRCEACKRKTDVGQDHGPSSIQDCTEMEYLRNILYEYMMGKEPLVLAKVLCALVKFDENQTKEIVSKEEHRITLFGQLGLL